MESEYIRHRHGTQNIWSVTGHRPDKLGGYDYPERDKYLIDLAATILSNGVLNKPDLVLIGMAQGWDTCVAYACLLADIPYIAAVPFSGQEGMWPWPVKQQYYDLLRRAAEVVIVSPGGYEAWKMMARNAWMIERTTSHVLALWNGDTSGGTASTVAMAKSHHKWIVNAWPDFQAWALFEGLTDVKQTKV